MTVWLVVGHVWASRVKGRRVEEEGWFGRGVRCALEIETWWPMVGICRKLMQDAKRNRGAGRGRSGLGGAEALGREAGLGSATELALLSSASPMAGAGGCGGSGRSGQAGQRSAQSRSGERQLPASLSMLSQETLSGATLVRRKGEPGSEVGTEGSASFD
ncbi:hypothetical protein VTI74DRAFT_1547 [Chaetomium olivicolor]